MYPFLREYGKIIYTHMKVKDELNLRVFYRKGNELWAVYVENNKNVLVMGKNPTITDDECIDEIHSLFRRFGMKIDYLGELIDIFDHSFCL